jgi:threonine/homoserine/homoserine lactone efflux protein
VDALECDRRKDVIELINRFESARRIWVERMSLSMMGGFLLAVVVGAMVPGATTALVVRRSALHGPAAAVPVIAGVELGLFAWAFATAVGTAALVAVSKAAFLGLKIAGACVLVFLGVQAWRAARKDTVDELPQTAASRGRWRDAGAGLLTSLANPKVAVFTFAFYPQFVAAGPGIVHRTLLLALVQVVVDGSWFLLVAMMVGRIRGLFSRAKVRRVLERATGTVLVALGLGVLAENG